MNPRENSPGVPQHNNNNHNKDGNDHNNNNNNNNNKDDNDHNNNKSKRPTVDLVFKVWAPKLNRMTHRLFLLGSFKQMGEWNMQTAVKASPTSEFHTWRVDIQEIPIYSSFEWSWVKAKANRTEVRWERMYKRNRTVDCFGGVIHTIYGDGEEVFVQSATYAEVTTYRKVEQGQALVLTGSSHTVGAWDVERAVRATEYPRLSGYWKVQIAFDSSNCLHFKWAILTDNNTRKVHIMEKESHALQGRQTWLRVVAPWNMARVFIEDTPICVEPLDHVTGRTDVLVNAKKAHTESIRHWLKADFRPKAPALVPINLVPAHKTAPFHKTTPRYTNEEKAKEALQALIAMSAGDPDKTLLGIGPGTASNPVPAIQQSLDKSEDERTKTAADTTERSERTNNKPSEKENIASFKPLMHIKGKGQTVVAGSSSQGRDGGSCMTPVHTVSNLIEISEEENNTGSPSNLGTASNETKSESKPAQEEDSGFDTLSQTSKTEEIISEGTPSSDELNEQDLPPSATDEGEKLHELFAKEDFSDGCIICSPTNSQGNQFNMHSSHSEPDQEEDGIRDETPPNASCFKQNEWPLFEEDDYLDYLSSKVTEEDGFVERIRRDRKMDIESLVSELDMRIPKDYFRSKNEAQTGKSSSYLSKLVPAVNLRSFHTVVKGMYQPEEVRGFERVEELEDMSEMERKRAMARTLEERWGAVTTTVSGNNNYPNNTDNDMMKTEQERIKIKESRQVLNEMMLPETFTTMSTRRSPISSFHFGDNSAAILVCPAGGGAQNKPLAAPYSNTEFQDVNTPPSDNNYNISRRRSIARQIEEEWGESPVL